MDIEAAARNCTNKTAWHYLSSGASMQQTMHENSEAFKQ